MSDILSIAAVLPGLIAGSLVVKLMIHWITLLLAGLGRGSDNTPLPQKSKLTWHLIFAVIHPVPWLLLLGVPYGIFHLAQDPPATGWLWFLGGTLFSVIATWLAAYIMTRKFNARAAAETESTTGGGNVA